MAKVISIHRLDPRLRDPRPPGCERALALMKEALCILDGLDESGQIEQGSCPDLTRSHLDNAIGMLEPEPD